ncbi:MAG TPA: ROK family protein [Actinospica sp.]|nr:ROK family protein [Actinospica sp.]
MPQQLYAAIDIGGTKIAAALVDAGGTLLTRAELPTPSGGSAEDVMAVVAKLVETLGRDPRWSTDVVGIGIGSAGPIDPVRGTVSPVNIPAWRDFPLVARVRELTSVPDEVILIGDGSAMAAGEHWRGAARGYDNALCMVVSTGVGAGLILDGALRTGPSGNAGHLGHISVDIEGEPCPCGSRGCVEIIASGTSIARWATENGWRTHPDNVVETNFPAPTAADVAESARAGNEIALAAFERAGRALAAGIACTAMLVDIKVAVIGGGVAKAGPVLFDPLRRHLTTYASLPFTRDLDILPATLGGDAGLIGAAAELARVVEG